MSTKLVCLSDIERHRLLMHASSFGVDVRLGENHVRIVDASAELDIELTWDAGWVRLFNEICSRSAPWLCFRVGTNARDTFFGLPDNKLSRIAFLYNQSKSRVELAAA